MSRRTAKRKGNTMQVQYTRVYRHEPLWPEPELSAVEAFRQAEISHAARLAGAAAHAGMKWGEYAAAAEQRAVEKRAYSAARSAALRPSKRMSDGERCPRCGRRRKYVSPAGHKRSLCRICNNRRCRELYALNKQDPVWHAARVSQVSIYRQLRRRAECLA